MPVRCFRETVHCRSRRSLPPPSVSPLMLEARTTPLPVAAPRTSLLRLPLEGSLRKARRTYTGSLARGLLWFSCQQRWWWGCWGADESAAGPQGSGLQTASSKGLRGDPSQYVSLIFTNIAFPMYVSLLCTCIWCSTRAWACLTGTYKCCRSRRLCQRMPQSAHQKPHS